MLTNQPTNNVKARDPVGSKKDLNALHGFESLFLLFLMSTGSLIWWNKIDRTSKIKEDMVAETKLMVLCLKYIELEQLQ